MVLIDIQSFLSTRIDGMLITASWVDKVKLLLGLQGVSQVWSETPTWSFWLTESPGPYELVLESIDQDKDTNSAIASGQFLVKLFPHPNGSAFAGFSREEQELVSSDLFDETNTMRFEARNRIHPHLFTIASIGISLPEKDDTGGLFTLEAPEVSRWSIRQHEKSESAHRAATIGIAQGNVIRNVPAWDLARCLFDRVVSLHAFAAEARPCRVVATSSPGFEVIQDDKGLITVEETSHIQLRTLSVLFASANSSDMSDMANILEQDTARPDCEILLDWQSACTCHSAPPPKDQDLVSEWWWRMAETERVSHHGSTCGCQ